MSIKRYYLYAGLNVHVFAKAEAVLKFSEEDDGMWVKWEDYARLKAEVERLTDCKAQADRFKAEVNRLTKAGDAMASSIQFNEEMAQDYNGPAIVHQSVQRWNAAKEGKQP
jgi:hypothetical protein